MRGRRGGKEQRAEFTREADRNQINDVVQSPKAAQLRGSLHSENEPSANRHQGDHRQRINADLQHLAHGCLPPITVPYKWQRVAYRAQRRPQLNVQTPDVVEFTDGPFSDVFENSCHQDTFDAEEILVQPLISNRANTPVTSNR